MSLLVYFQVFGRIDNKLMCYCLSWPRLDFHSRWDNLTWRTLKILIYNGKIPGLGLWVRGEGLLWRASWKHHLKEPHTTWYWLPLSSAWGSINIGLAFEKKNPKINGSYINSNFKYVDKFLWLYILL